jgi:mRNA-degrading endonuclease RelE of RelBE toxin-antitoxin system
MNSNELQIFEIQTYEDFDEALNFYLKKRKYKRLNKQVQDLIENFSKGIFDSSATPSLKHSETPTPYDIYKMRMANPDAGEGKSGGYRVVYMVRSHNKIIVLLTMYSKSDKANISDREIELLIDGYFMSELVEED